MVTVMNDLDMTTTTMMGSGIILFNQMNTTNDTTIDAATDAANTIGADVVLFVVICLGVGLLCRHIVEFYARIPLPYTLVLMIIGILWGLLPLTNNDSIINSSFVRGMMTTANMEPTLLLHIFIPALVFDSAFSSPYHWFERAAIPSILLAGPGVIVTAFITGGLSHLFNYHWDWSICLMFGAMLSATDPVAITALLRSLGAAKSLATLIEAEALYNDGSAFVMYLLCKDIVTGIDASIMVTIGNFLQITVGAIVFGFVFGYIAVMILSWIYGDGESEITGTIVSAYLCFWLAQSVLNVSGVLAIAVLGLYMSKQVDCVTPRMQGSMRTIWAMMSYWLNTLIFIISGVLVSEKMFSSRAVIDGYDVGYLILLYIILHVARAIAMMVSLGPCYHRIGYPLSPRERIILLIAGLRGALSLTLGLLTELEPDIDRIVRDKIMFHIAGIALLTLTINGTGSQWLIKYMRLHRGSPVAEVVLGEALRHVRQKTVQELDALRHDERFKLVDWTKVRRFLPDRFMPSLAMYQRLRQQTVYHHSDTEDDHDDEKDGGAGGDDAAANANPKKSLPSFIHVLEAKTRDNELNDYGASSSHLERLRATPAEVTDAHLRREVTSRFIAAMKADYARQFGSGMVTRRALRILTRAADVAEQRESIELQWQLVEQQLHVPWSISTMFQSPYQCCMRMVHRALFSHLAFSVELATSFLAASVRIDEVIAAFPELNEINANVVNDVKHTVHKYARRAYDSWMDVQRSYPEAYAALQTRHAAQILLLFEQRALRGLADTGILGDDEYNKLDALVDEKMYWLERSLVTGIMRPADEIFGSLSWIKHLPAEKQRWLLMHATKRLVPHGSYLSKRDDINDGLFVVTRGIVTTSFHLPPSLASPSPPLVPIATTTATTATAAAANEAESSPLASSSSLSLSLSLTPDAAPPTIVNDNLGDSKRAPLSPLVPLSVATAMVLATDVSLSSSSLVVDTASPAAVATVTKKKRPVPPSLPRSQSVSMSSSSSTPMTSPTYHQTFPPPNQPRTNVSPLLMAMQQPKQPPQPIPAPIISAPTPNASVVPPSSNQPIVVKVSPPPLSPPPASIPATVPPTPTASPMVYDGTHMVEKYTSGVAIDAYSALTGNISMTNIRSLTLVEGYHFRREVIQVLLDDPMIALALWRQAAVHVMKSMFLSHLHPELQAAGRRHATNNNTAGQSPTAPTVAASSATTAPYGSTLATLPRVHFTDDTLFGGTGASSPKKRGHGGHNIDASSIVSSTCAWTYLMEYLMTRAAYHQVPRAVKSFIPADISIDMKDSDNDDTKAFDDTLDNDNDRVGALPSINLHTMFDKPLSYTHDHYQLNGRTLVLSSTARVLLLTGSAKLVGSSTSFDAPVLLTGGNGTNGDISSSTKYMLIGVCHIFCWRHHDELHVCRLRLPTRHQPYQQVSSPATPMMRHSSDDKQREQTPLPPITAGAAVSTIDDHNGNGNDTNNSNDTNNEAIALSLVTTPKTMAPMPTPMAMAMPIDDPQSTMTGRASHLLARALPHVDHTPTHHDS